MAKVNDILALVDEIAPFSATIDGLDDNVGLLVGRRDAEVTKVLCCLDASLPVIAEAAEAGAELIVSHHPVIFSPQKAVTDHSEESGRALAAIESGIAIISAHTNLDIAAGGVNDYAARLCGLEGVTPMRSDGYGRIGTLPLGITLKVFAAGVADEFCDDRVGYLGSGDEQVRRVAVVNGSGGDVDTMKLALSLGADVLVTGEVKHHAAVFALEKGLKIVEVGHFACEHAYVPVLAARLSEIAQKRGMGVGFSVSQSEKPPFFAAKRNG